jgi:hypothetical protein
VTFAAPAGVNIAGRWQVRLNSAGAMGGMVNDKPLATTVQIESQYPLEQK